MGFSRDKRGSLPLESRDPKLESQPGAPRKGLAQASALLLGTMRAAERNSGKPPTEEVGRPPEAYVCGLVVVHLVHGRLHVQIVGRTAHVE